MVWFGGLVGHPGASSMTAQLMSMLMHLNLSDSEEHNIIFICLTNPLVLRSTIMICFKLLPFFKKKGKGHYQYCESIAVARFVLVVVTCRGVSSALR